MKATLVLTLASPLLCVMVVLAIIHITITWPKYRVRKTSWGYVVG